MPGVLRQMLTRVTASLRAPTTAGGWYPVIREPATGAWQKNEALAPETVLANPTVFRCVSLITTDIAKCRLRLVALDDGIWTETTNSAYTPVLRRPNRYQLIGQFLEAWMTSRLLYGNVYVLKERDARGVVRALYVLDPRKVQPLIAPDGAVYYELQANELAGLPPDASRVVLPASDVIHDRWNCLFHPLVGIPPLYACSATANQALQMQSTSTAFFANGGRPVGILTAPGAISDDQVSRMRTEWRSALETGTPILSNGITYQGITENAVDAQLTEQSKWTANVIAGVFGVPVSMVDSSQQPPYANSEASVLQYHAQCLQAPMTSIEACLDDGLELGTSLGTEFDIDDLIWMDTTTKTKAAHDAINAGALSPNEARRKYFGLGPVPGGDSPYLQQQNYSLEALAKRDAAPPAPAPAAPPPPPVAPDEIPDDEEVPA